MFTLRRWDRKGLQIGLVALVVGGAWAIRQTQGAFVLEAYQTITRPFESLQPGPTPEEQRNDARMVELQTRITELESQNKKLQNLLSYQEKEKAATRPITARVVGRSADHWWQQVTLNRGSLAGIKQGDVVKAEGGLVGLIDAVSPNTSRVLLISDLKSQVGVTISRTGAKGVLHGDGSGEGVLEFYEKVPNVKPGDLISTSTYSQKFPSGLGVGILKSLDSKRTQMAKVQLSPPIRSLEWVAVYPKPEQANENVNSAGLKPQKSN